MDIQQRGVCSLEKGSIELWCDTQGAVAVNIIGNMGREGCQIIRLEKLFNFLKGQNDTRV